MPTERMSGSVKFFEDDRGFGFIVGDDGRDYFTHRTKIRGPVVGIATLTKGEKVTFDPSSSGRGPIALDVVRVA
jgi:cold shock protein